LSVEEVEGLRHRFRRLSVEWMWMWIFFCVYSW
jgi:hypothetical protein